MISGISLDEEIKAKLSAGRTQINETRTVSILKPDKNVQDYNK